MKQIYSSLLSSSERALRSLITLLLCATITNATAQTYIRTCPGIPTFSPKETGPFEWYRTDDPPLFLGTGQTFAKDSVTYGSGSKALVYRYFDRTINVSRIATAFTGYAPKGSALNLETYPAACINQPQEFTATEYYNKYCFAGNGVNTYARANGYFPTTSTDNFTIRAMVKVKPNSALGNGEMCIFQNGNTSCGYALLINNNTRKLSVELNGVKIISTDIALTEDRFYNVALQRKSGEWRVMVDDRIAFTHDLTPFNPFPSLALNAGFSVGARYENTAVFSGYIDEVRVHDEALDWPDVYMGEGGTVYLQSQWNFEEITTVATGSTPNLIDGKPPLMGDANARACPATYIWNFNGIEQRANSNKISYSFPSTGVKNVSFKIMEPFGCISQSAATKQVLVKSNAQPPLSISASNNGPFCSNTTSVNLTAQGGSSLISEEFDGNPTGWSSSGNGGWMLGAYLYFRSSDESNVFSITPTSSNYIPTINANLISPAISTMGVGSLKIEMNHYIGLAALHRAKVQATTDSITWVDIKAFPESAVYGHHENFVTDVITVPSAFLNKPKVRFRLSYYQEQADGNWPAGWLINWFRAYTSEFPPVYKWSSNPAGLVSNRPAPPAVKPLETTTYTVTYNTGCLVTASTTVTVRPLPSATISVNNASVCKNGQAPIITFTGSGDAAPYQFMYRINNGADQYISTLTTQNSATLTIPTNTPLNYRIEVWRVQGLNCTKNLPAGTAVNVAVRDFPTGTITGTTAVCGNNIGNVTFTGNNGVAPYTFGYSYNTGNVTLNNSVSSIGNNSSTSFVPNTSVPGTSTLYQLTTVTDAAGCASSYDYNSPNSSMSVTAFQRPGLSLQPIPIAGPTETSFPITFIQQYGSVDRYSIRAAPTNAMPGFVPVNNVAITTNPIVVNIPPSSIGSYKFLLLLKSTISGCADTIPFTLGVASKNNSLRSFEILNVPLTPSFDAATITYTAGLTGTTELIKVIAVKDDPLATIKINDVPYNSGDTLTITSQYSTINIGVMVTSPDNSLKYYQFTTSYQSAAPPHNAIALRGGYEHMYVHESLFNNLPAGTYELWVNPDNAKPGCFMSKQNNSGPSQSIFGVGFTQNKVGNDSLAQPGIVYFRGRPSGPIIASKNALPSGRWSHVAVTFTATGASLYINGELESTASGDFSVPDDVVNKNASIGSWEGYWNYGFAGKMDEVRIWSRARTQAEIQYGLRNIPGYNSTDLKAYYNFDYGIRGVPYIGARNVYDLTGHRFDAVLVSNAPTEFNWVESFATVLPITTDAANVTSTGFTANWTSNYDLPGYLLDVATDSLFTQFVEGYKALNVSALSSPVSGLQSGTTYYYRVRGEKASVTGQGAYSNVSSVKTIGHTMNNLDLPAGVSAAPAYSLRLLTTNYSGASITVRRSSDNTIADIGFDATGHLDTLALTTFAGADTAFVQTWFDQSGYKINATQDVQSRQPYVMAAGKIIRLNQRPSVYFGASDLATAKQIIYTNGVSMTGVVKGSSNTTSTFVSKTGTAANANLNFPGPFDYANTGNEFVAGNAETFALGSLNVGTTWVNAQITSSQPANIHGFDIPVSPSFRIYLNGDFVGGANLSGAGDNGNSLRIGNRNDMGGSGNFFTPELVLFNSVLSGTDRDSATASQRDYYFSANANLASLTTAAGPITGKFDSLTYSYKASLAANTLTTLVATAANSGASIDVRINNGAWMFAPNGKVSGNITLNTSINNVIDIRVTAQAGNTKTYSITLVKTNRLNQLNLTSEIPSSPAYSLRLLSSDYTGKAINVRRSNDNATLDIGFTTAGDLDTLALKTFTGPNTAFVTRWYDQSGYGVDAFQQTSATQPVIVTNGVVERLNTRPAVYFGTANLGTSQEVLFTVGASMIGVAKGNSETASCLISKTGTSTGASLAHPGPFEYTNAGAEMTVGDASTTTYSIIRTNTTSPVSLIKAGVPAAVHSFVIPAVTGSKFYNFVNGVEAGNENVVAFMDNKNSIRIGNRNSMGSSGNLWVPEIVLFNDALQPATRITAEEAQKAYYFIPCTPVIDQQPSSETVCPGGDVLLNAAASGYNLTYVWKKNNTTVVGSESTLSLSDVSAADAGIYTCTITGICTSVVTNTVTITVTDPAALDLPTAGIIAKTVVAAGVNYFTDNCASLAAAVQSGGSYTIAGNATANVWLEQPGAYPDFVKRHYEITSAFNNGTATGKVTLYFTQDDFTAYNLLNAIKLPVNAADIAGIANLRIEKYVGITKDSSGLPASYITAPVIINPADNNIVWNNTKARWEVSFDATGFGGFFAKTVAVVLPVRWLSVTGNINTVHHAVINWKVAETDVQHYTVEKSTDGNSFSSVTQIGSRGNGTNSYSFTDPQILDGKGYYRVKQTGKNGAVAYSAVVQLETAITTAPNVSPNPTEGAVNVTVSKQLLQTNMRVYDVHGRQLQLVKITGSSFIIDLGNYAQGMYIFAFEDGSIVKVLKQ